MEQKKAVKETKEKVEKVAKPKKEKPKNQSSMVSLIREFWGKQHKDRKELIDEVYNEAKKRGKTVNSKGRTIEPKNLSTLLSAIFGDIDRKRPGWWSNCEVKETETSLIVIEKK